MDNISFSLSIIDSIIIIGYFLIILFVGFVISKRKEDSSSKAEDFILAGRKLTLPVLVGTLVATWYGNILGVGEFVYNDGLVAWVCFGLPYYVTAAIFAIFIAGKIRGANVLTIPEQISNHYGPRSGQISSYIILVITVPASYVLMLGVIIQMFTGWELWMCISIGAALSFAYLFTGGFRADVLTNSVQFVFMFLGFGALFFYAWTTLPGFSELKLLLPDEHLSFTGLKNWQYILVWYIIALQTFIDPSFHQRCSAAKDKKTAKRGILLSIVFWIVFDFLTLSTGLYAKAALDLSNPLLAYPALAEHVLPSVWKGIFIVALLSTVMSTLDSYAFISATTIGNDILKKLKFFKNYAVENLTRLGLLITAIFAVVMAISLPSAIDLIYKTSSIAVPGIFLPILISFSKNISIKRQNMIILMSVSSGISFIWTIFNILSVKSILIFPDVFIDVEPMIPGILSSVILAALFVKRKVKSTC